MAAIAYALVNNASTGTILLMVGIYLLVTWDDDEAELGK